ELSGRLVDPQVRHGPLKDGALQAGAVAEPDFQLGEVPLPFARAEILPPGLEGCVDGLGLADPGAFEIEEHAFRNLTERHSRAREPPQNEKSGEAEAPPLFNLIPSHYSRDSNSVLSPLG